jgi:hypothetical protein
VEGRSGGGLFYADGRLVGVCNWRDALGQGGYAAPTSIKRFLTQLKMDWVYTAGGNAPRAGVPSPAPSESPSPLPRALKFDGSDPMHLGFAGLGTWVLLSSVYRWGKGGRVNGLAGQISTLVAGDPLTEMRNAVMRMRADEEAKARAAEVDELLPKLRDLLSPGPKGQGGDVPSAGA